MQGGGTGPPHNGAALEPKWLLSLSLSLACLLRGLAESSLERPLARRPAPTRSARSPSEGPLFGAERGVPPNAQSRTQPPEPRLRPSPLQDQCIVAIRVIRSL